MNVPLILKQMLWGLLETDEIGQMKGATLKSFVETPPWTYKELIVKLKHIDHTEVDEIELARLTAVIKLPKPLVLSLNPKAQVLHRKLAMHEPLSPKKKMLGIVHGENVGFGGTPRAGEGMNRGFGRGPRPVRSPYNEPTEIRLPAHTVPKLRPPPSKRRYRSRARRNKKPKEEKKATPPNRSGQLPAALLMYQKQSQQTISNFKSGGRVGLPAYGSRSAPPLRPATSGMRSKVKNPTLNLPPMFGS